MARFYLIVLHDGQESHQRVVQRNTRRAAAATARGWLRRHLGESNTRRFFDRTYVATQADYDAQEKADV